MINVRAESIMISETAEKLRPAYRLQQSKLVSISQQKDLLGGIGQKVEDLCAEQLELAGQLQEGASRSWGLIRRLANWNDKKKKADQDGMPLSDSRMKSLLHMLREFYDTSSSAAEKCHQLSDGYRNMAAQMDLSFILMKHFISREQIFMAVILSGRENEIMKRVRVRTSLPGRWYDERGDKLYSHLPAYRSLKESDSRYCEMMNEIMDDGGGLMNAGELYARLAKLDMLSQQVVLSVCQLQHYVELQIREH
ncbi:chemotaxis protein [Salmonella enterica]|nr:chemotaxis protein [Salmonella enterica]EBL8180923.1 chemotaxis protein [Salmonella enterica]EJG3779133.1 chemotaxis protein [Salmonella enterica]EJM0403484.1 chemotaxis protein [Salmonella enterica]EKH2730873.1 chemotaxis protein [Salmonella enterica]